MFHDIFCVFHDIFCVFISRDECFLFHMNENCSRLCSYIYNRKRRLQEFFSNSQHNIRLMVTVFYSTINKEIYLFLSDSLLAFVHDLGRMWGIRPVGQNLSHRKLSNNKFPWDG